MIINLQREFHKFWQERLPWYGVVGLGLLMGYTAITTTDAQTLMAQGFGIDQWVIIILITVSSQFLAMEYQNHTILNLLYRARHQWQVYFAKALVLISYSGLLLCIGSVFTFLLKPLVIGARDSWFTAAQQSQTLSQAFLLNQVGTLVYSLFVVTLALCLLAIVHVNGVVIGIGLIVGFWGVNISRAIMLASSNLAKVVAWNPLNMINVITQLSEPSGQKISNLTNGQLIGGNLIYTALFLSLGYICFKHRHI
ncbi:ABC transporter permease [Lactobacillus sp. CC-MHH1034]|uniref:ABC transporter permease n=1 Tax=Agrilactobacillus fermenti TaxID=2586909 RepID=UPI001E46D595|nr:ABC transporter permease [Agrilactobacillus fermenti]MCD2256389.1 ABC transporter permease [Agrilactobacillus fermenti]